MPKWSQTNGSDQMFPDVLDIDPDIILVPDAVESEEGCNAFSDIWWTAVWNTNVSPECVTPAMTIVNVNAKEERSVPTRKRGSKSEIDLGTVVKTRKRASESEIDLEKVDEKTRKRLMKNRASAEKSRKARILKMQELHQRCEEQEQEIKKLREQLEDLINFFFIK